MLNWNADMFIGGHAVLDFLNTVGDYGKTRNDNSIGDWESFQSWIKASGHFSGMQIRTETPESLLAEIHQLRETTHCVLSATANGEPLPAKELSALEAKIKFAIDRAHLSIGKDDRGWVPTSENPNQVYDQLVLAIEDFLRTQDLGKLHECGRCTWLFIGKGRGKGRQWCDMKKCGNRAKSQAFRDRKDGYNKA